MGAWFGFYQTAAEVSATLLGLLVVAISINLKQIIDTPHLPDRAAGAMIPLAGVLVIAMLGQISGQPVQLFGLEVLSIGAAMSILQARTLIKSLPRYRDVPGWWLWSRILLTQGQSPLAAVAAVMLTFGHLSGLYWSAPAIIFAMLGGVTNAWVLLVEILR